MTEPSDDPLEKLLLAGNTHAGICVGCGARPGLYIVKEMFVSLCARCVAAKIIELRRRSSPLPGWVVQLEGEVTRELAYQERKEREALQVSFNDLCKCRRCGRIIHARDVRYPPESAAPGRPPHCIECYAAVVTP